MGFAVHMVFPRRKVFLDIYPNIPSAMRPVPHGDGLPVPVPPDNSDEGDSETSAAPSPSKPNSLNDADFVCNDEYTEIHKITQCKLNDLV